MQEPVIDAAATREQVPATAKLALLVQCAQRGDRAAFAAIYQQYHPVVHSVLLSRVGPQEADDLVHEVFLRALAKLRHLANAAELGGWLCAIARNCARDWWRSRAQQPQQHEFLADKEVVEQRPQPESNTSEEDARRALAAIQRLPEAYRETLIMRLVEGLSGPAIAERTGLTHGSVRVNLHRGMQLLRKELAEWKP